MTKSIKIDGVEVETVEMHGPPPVEPDLMNAFLTSGFASGVTCDTLVQAAAIAIVYRQVRYGEACGPRCAMFDEVLNSNELMMRTAEGRS
jgi:hypothetical protein